MKFTFKVPQETPLFSMKNAGWFKLDELNRTKKIIYGLLVGLISVGILDVFIGQFILREEFDFFVYKKIYLFFLLIPAHELIHALFSPNLKETTIGFYTKSLIFFVNPSGILTKKRLMLLLFSPFFCLTIVPLILLVFFRLEIFAYIALYNMLGSGVDVISMIEISKHKNKSLFQFNGAELYINNQC